MNQEILKQEIIIKFHFFIPTRILIDRDMQLLNKDSRNHNFTYMISKLYFSLATDLEEIHFLCLNSSKDMLNRL